MPLTLDQANRVVAATLARAREARMPPVGVAVLDAGGHLKAAQCEDGLAFLRARVCQAKAWGALALGASSRHLAERYAAGGIQAGFIDGLNALSDGGVVPLAGGVLIRDDAGRLVGAVGVAGGASEDDEACAVAGIEAAGLVPDLDSTR